MKLEGLKIIILKEEGEERILLEKELKKEGAQTVLTDGRENQDKILEKISQADRLVLWREWKNTGYQEEETETVWNRIFGEYIKEEVLLLEDAASCMKPGSRIILIYSSEAFAGIEYGKGISTLAQGTRRSMVSIFSQTLGKKQIYVNGIAYASGKNKKVDALHYPLGYAEISHIAGTVIFLCSSDASYINGNTILLDGGNLLAYRRYQIGK